MDFGKRHTSDTWHIFIGDDKLATASLLTDLLLRTDSSLRLQNNQRGTG